MSAESPGLNGTLRLLVGVFEKQIILLRRYWINTASWLVGSYFFFVLIFFGGRAVAGAALENSLEGLVIGFFLWMAALSAFRGASDTIQREAQWGTLEQLFMSPHGLVRVIASLTVWQVTISVGLTLPLLGVMLVTTGQSLAVDPITITLLTVLALLSASGLGLVFAGLSLLYKRIENTRRITQYVLVALIAAPAADLPVPPAALPLAKGSQLLTRAMERDMLLWDLPIIDIGLLLVNGLLYLLVGYVVFFLCVRRARRLGVLGHY